MNGSHLPKASTWGRCVTDLIVTASSEWRTRLLKILWGQHTSRFTMWNEYVARLLRNCTRRVGRAAYRLRKCRSSLLRSPPTDLRRKIESLLTRPIPNLAASVLCDVTQSRIWHDYIICVTRLIQSLCSTTRSHHFCVTRFMDVCDMIPSHTSRDSLDPWDQQPDLISSVWHDVFNTWRDWVI